MTALIELKDIRRSFKSERGGSVEVLKGIDLTIEAGTFNVIRGESGSGKTTLLKVVGLLDGGFSGSYQFHGAQMSARPDWWLDEIRAANIGFIFQDGQLFEHMTMAQNIELPLQLQGSPEQRREARARVAGLTPTFFNERELYARVSDDTDDALDVEPGANGSPDAGEPESEGLAKSIAYAGAAVSVAPLPVGSSSKKVEDWAPDKTGETRATDATKQAGEEEADPEAGSDETGEADDAPKPGEDATERADEEIATAAEARAGESAGSDEMDETGAASAESGDAAEISPAGDGSAPTASPPGESSVTARSLLDELPKVASGGQRQRAAVMRSIIHEPCLILADEPTASLDQPRKKQVRELLLGLAEQGHTVVVVTHDHLFYDVGHQYEMLDGRLTDHGDAEPDTTREAAPRIEPHFPETGQSILWGWRPRSAAAVLVRQALRETFQRWLFLLLILSALVAGVTQISVFSSVITGAEVIVDKAFTEGSRLNRLEIKPKLVDFDKPVRFPVIDKIKAWPNVAHVVPRRTTLVRIKEKSGRSNTRTAMGLHDDDPEYKLLDFLGGGPFTRDTPELELIVTASLLSQYFDTEGLGQKDGKTYADFIGRDLTMMVNRYSRSGKLRESIPVVMKIKGIILHAEGGREVYLPNRTQIIFDRVTADRNNEIQLPVTKDGKKWTLDAAGLSKFLDGPWEDKLQVYTTGVRDIIPVIRQLSALKYRPKSDIWNFKWALDIQDIAWQIFMPLLALIIAAVTLTVMANIYTSAKLREKEFALWRVLGMRRGDLALLQVAAAIFAILIGALIGLIVAWLVVDQSRAFLAGQYADKGFDQIFAPVEQFFGMILGGALFVGVLAAVAPAIRTARVDPARVLQS